MNDEVINIDDININQITNNNTDTQNNSNINEKVLEKYLIKFNTKKYIAQTCSWNVGCCIYPY